MADPEALLTTIDDYLLSIAEGIHSAQLELDRASLAGHGMAYAYYLPKLDFELRMTIEMRERKTGVGAKNRPLLFLRPVSTLDSTTSMQAISTVRGSFLAVPSGAAAKALRASAMITWKGDRQGMVTVELLDSGGNPQQGQEVNFNVDRDLSRRASLDRLKKTFTMDADTTFSDPVVRTDGSGRASSIVNISAKEPLGAVVAIVLDVAGQTETILHEISQGGTN